MMSLPVSGPIVFPGGLEDGGLPPGGVYVPPLSD